jgi:hypothetical protein
MFAKLTSTKLASKRALRHARPGLGPEPILCVAPAHANDNHLVRPNGAGARGRQALTCRPRGRQALTCRWVATAAGRLECRWFLADSEAGGPDEPGGTVGRMKRPVALGGRRVALVTD